MTPASKRRIPKYFLLICFAFLSGSVSGQKLTGTESFSQTNRYTEVDWEISYNFYVRDKRVFIKFHSPKITVSPSSLYNHHGQLFSKSDLGISRWPEEEQDPLLHLTVTASHAGETFTTTTECYSGCTDGITKGDENDLNINNYEITAVNRVWYNGGPDPAVMKLIFEKEQGKTSQDNSAADETKSIEETGSSANGSTNAARNAAPHVPSAESQMIALGIDPNRDYQHDIMMMSAHLIAEWVDDDREIRDAERRLKEESEKALREDLNQQLQTLEAKAKAGDAQSMFRLGRLYTSKMIRNYEMAEFWCREAYKYNLPEAIHFWALTDMTGRFPYTHALLDRGAPKYKVNEKEGIMKFERAAQSGHIPSVLVLADLYAGNKVEFYYLAEERYKNYVDPAKARYYSQLVYRINQVKASSYAIDKDPDREGIISLANLPYLGIGMEHLNPKYAREKGLKRMTGVYLTLVAAQSPAEKAGLVTGDIILKIMDTRVDSIVHVQRQVAKYYPGDKITVTYERRGITKVAETVLTNRIGETSGKRFGLDEFLGFQESFLRKIPSVLESPSPSWRRIIEFQDPSTEIFGKTAVELSANTLFRESFTNSSAAMRDLRKHLEEEKASEREIDGISGIFQTDVHVYYEIPFKVNGVFKKHFAHLIFDEEKKVIGLNVDFFSHTDDVRSEEYENIDEKIADVISALGAHYMKINEHTYLYHDKLIIFENTARGSVTLFDLEILKDKIQFFWPKEYIDIHSISKGQYVFRDMGLSYQTYYDAKVNSARLAMFRENSDKGAVVLSVKAGSIADKAGIAANDIITEVRDMKIKDPFHLELILHGYTAERKYIVKYLRAGKEYTTTMTLD